MVTKLVENFSPSHISPYHTFIATVYKKVKFKNTLVTFSTFSFGYGIWEKFLRIVFIIYFVA
jgi:hypothetical protein